MSANDNLVTWLRAQLDDDERLLDEYEAFQRGLPVAAIVVPPGWLLGEPFDVGRQRAEVDAKRDILDACESNAEDGTTSGAILAKTILPLLALPYADRDGYRPEWAPDA